MVSAIQARPRIQQYLQQSPEDPTNLESAKRQLAELVGVIDQLDKVLRVQAAKKAGGK